MRSVRLIPMVVRADLHTNIRWWHCSACPEAHTDAVCDLSLPRASHACFHCRLAQPSLLPTGLLLTYLALVLRQYGRSRGSARCSQCVEVSTLEIFASIAKAVGIPLVWVVQGIAPMALRLWG